MDILKIKMDVLIYKNLNSSIIWWRFLGFFSDHMDILSDFLQFNSCSSDIGEKNVSGTISLDVQWMWPCPSYKNGEGVVKKRERFSCHWIIFDIFMR